MRHVPAVFLVAFSRAHGLGVWPRAWERARVGPRLRAEPEWWGLSLFTQGQPAEDEERRSVVDVVEEQGEEEEEQQEAAAAAPSSFDWASWLGLVSEAGRGQVDVSAAVQALVQNATTAATEELPRLLLSSISDLAKVQPPKQEAERRPAEVTASEIARFEALSSSRGHFASSEEWSRRASRCAELSAAAYANAEAALAFQGLGCARVASGVSSDVAWHIVDSAAGGRLERHIVIRGFDASDATIDRLALVRRILAAAPTPLPAKRPDDIDDVIAQLGGKKECEDSGPPPQDAGDSLLFRKRCVHSGFLAMAEAILRDIEEYLLVEGAPNCDLFLVGHSIGGSLAAVISLLCRQRKLAAPSVFTFAALPCVSPGFAAEGAHVHGFVQPWDPLVRWYTKHDPCYPLVSDVGLDGLTLFASGPPRVLRPLTRAIFQASAEWPSIRDLYATQANQTYRPIGTHYLVLPHTSRFVADRNVGWQIDVPAPQAFARLDSDHLHDVLTDLFPLDEFAISLLPAALRSFVHHFYPAYSETIKGLCQQQQQQQQQLDDDLTAGESAVPFGTSTQSPRYYAAPEAEAEPLSSSSSVRGPSPSSSSSSTPPRPPLVRSDDESTSTTTTTPVVVAAAIADILSIGDVRRGATGSAEVVE